MCVRQPRKCMSGQIYIFTGFPTGLSGITVYGGVYMR